MHAFRHARLLLALSLALHPPAALAAQQEIGQIDRIVEILGATTVQSITGPTDKVRIRTGAADRWFNSAPRARVRTDQGIRVERNVDARLEVRSATHRGTLVFLPELLHRAEGRVFPAEVVGETLAEGLYAIPAGGAGAELRLVLEQGALVVDWIHGRLVVEAAGTETVIRGTRVALSVAPGGDGGLLYLEAGAVEFPGFQEVAPGPGQLVHLRRGLPPRLWHAAAEVIEPSRVEEAIRYHAQEVWPRPTPFYRRPVFLVSAATVVGAVVWAAAGSGSDGGGEGPSDRGGTVILQFPLP